MKSISFLLAFSLTLTVIQFDIQAHNTVVVVPYGFNGQSDNIDVKNVITVAKSGGDFSDPREALKSITDASENNRYVVYIAPGIYNLFLEGIVLRPYVSVVGAGAKSTILQTEVADVIGNPIVNPQYIASATLEGNNTISNLKIVNTGRGAQVGLFGIYVNGSDVSISDVEVDISQTQTSFVDGITVAQTVDDVLIQNTLIKILVRDGHSAGVASYGNGVLIRNTNIEMGVVPGTPISFTGLVGIESGDVSSGLKSLQVSNVVIFVEGSGESSGVTGMLLLNSSAEIEYAKFDVIVSHQGSGLEIVNNSDVNIFGSTIQGLGTYISAILGSESTTVNIANSQIVGSINGVGNLQCFNNYDEDFEAVTCP